MFQMQILSFVILVSIYSFILDLTNGLLYKSLAIETDRSRECYLLVNISYVSTKHLFIAGDYLIVSVTVC